MLRVSSKVNALESRIVIYSIHDEWRWYWNFGLKMNENSMHGLQTRTLMSRFSTDWASGYGSVCRCVKRLDFSGPCIESGPYQMWPVTKSKAESSLASLRPLARTRPRNGHLKTNRTDLVYFCSPCMSSPPLSRTVRCSLQVGNQTHIFEVGEGNWAQTITNKYKHCIRNTHVSSKLRCKCCWESPLFPGTGLNGSMDIRSLTPSVQWSQRNGRWSFSDQLWKQQLLKIAWWALFVLWECSLPPFLPFLHLSIHFTQPFAESSPFLLKAWLSCAARHLACPVRHQLVSICEASGSKGTRLTIFHASVRFWDFLTTNQSRKQCNLIAYRTSLWFSYRVLIGSLLYHRARILTRSVSSRCTVRGRLAKAGEED